ncbi:unnamed protein product [Cyprideis torosa]|uniref:Uncharacterized protein n=1 Tax=Cyprideis torosa TaxID=163714 RepID=A0A7R8W240_9CRUS|nr:unnamed protein product [Cyprideis torosa]CAG0880570.1 unnamed protein product [Cyprideis torosa]
MGETEDELFENDPSEYICEGGKRPYYMPKRPVSGVIGASSSSVSIMVANILRMFKAIIRSLNNLWSSKEDNTEAGQIKEDNPEA